MAIEEASGHSGGIWMLSTDNTVSVELIQSFSQVITLKLKKGSSEWMSSLIYASHVPSSRVLL